jgi:hypothetical protein
MFRRRIRIQLLYIAAAAVSLTCSGNDIGAPPQPAAIVMISGDHQIGQINQTLPAPLVVQVKDADGAPAAGVSVGWSVEGGGTVDKTSVVTGSDGNAAVHRVLGSTAGEVTATASVPGLPAVVFVSTVQAGAQKQLTLAVQPSSEALTNVPLSRQPVIRVDDEHGEPAGAGIVVSVAVEGASLAGTTAIESDPYGEVHFNDLALSGPDGTYNLTFSAVDVVSVRSEPITLTSAPPVRTLVITGQPSPTAESGVLLAQQPVIRVEGDNGQPVAGVPVTASVATGTLSGTTTVTTAASGEARFTDLAIIGASGSYKLVFAAPNAASLESATISLTSTSAQGGQWTAPFSWPIVPIHTMLLPDGRVLAIGRSGVPQVWNPANGSFTSMPTPAWLFCSGHALLADGRVFVAGGHIDDGLGLPNITYFSAETNSWTSGPPMARGRWYPTTTVMGNGDVVIIAGTDEDSVNVTIPEVWTNGVVRQLTGADQPLPWYPRAFLAPDGSLFVAGPTVATRFLSTAGSGSWRNGARHLFERERTYGGAVMYDDGKILYAGGGLTTNTAEVIDLNQPVPTWQFTSPMAFARRHHNLTVLPTGDVLATTGVGGTTFNDVSKGVHAAELWSPQTGQWTTLASNAVTRGYHGTSLLLPDGRVLNAGGGEGAGAPDERNAELFSPPYLLRGARPVITSAPAEVPYGGQISIQTPDAAAITKVSLIRLGAVTHAFDENQRFQWLSFTASPGGLTITAPVSPNRTPPGHYMLFILNGNNVPSVAKIIRIF